MSISFRDPSKPSSATLPVAQAQTGCRTCKRRGCAVDLVRCLRCGMPETHETIEFDAEGICNVCRQHEFKQQSIDWDSRGEEFARLIETYRGKYAYDCLVPFSGGKDSTFTLLHLMKKYGVKPLVVHFNHGFMRTTLLENNERTFRQLGVDVHTFTPNWRLVRRLMLESLIRKGDFCWHCHTGIFAYPMQVAVKLNVPLVIWGEPSSEYTAYYDYRDDEVEEVDETAFNRFINLGITAEDMAGMIRGDFAFDPRDLAPYAYPPLRDLKRIKYRSVCLGSYIPWDAKSQSDIIQKELGWRGEQVEGMPWDLYSYEKIECYMQGVRDYIKFLKRGFSRVSQMAALDIRNGRMTRAEEEALVDRYEGRRPASLDLFLEYLGLTEDEFNAIVLKTAIAPHRPDFASIDDAPKTWDFDRWYRERARKPSRAPEAPKALHLVSTTESKAASTNGTNGNGCFDCQRGCAVQLVKCTRCGLPETYETIEFDDKGVCNICRQHEFKTREVDWSARKSEFKALVEQYRGKYDYDCIIPFSGGKDSTFTLYHMVKTYGVKPLVVQFNHGFMRPTLAKNNERTFKELGVDVHTFEPNWRVVRRVMLESLVRKGDFCWHCHTGIFSYPMHVAIKYKVPFIVWGEPSSEYTAYYDYRDNEIEEVDETRFNRFINLGITAEDMAGMIGKDFTFDPRDLAPFTYPPVRELKKLQYRSVCLGSYIPWDAKKQSELIREELGWEGDQVEGMPWDLYPYEKIECSMQGVRDYIKFLKRGYSRVTQMTALDLRGGRLDKHAADELVRMHEGKKPPALRLFLDYLGVTEDKFNQIVMGTVVPPHKPDFSTIDEAPRTWDYDQWYRETQPLK